MDVHDSFQSRLANQTEQRKLWKIIGPAYFLKREGEAEEWGRV
jgi:hypothetical protein